MSSRLYFLLAMTLLFGFAFSQQSNIPIWNNQNDHLTVSDWLISPVATKSQLYRSADSKDIIFYNGLVKRTFRLSPNLACTNYANMITGQQLLRGVMPEAMVNINGIDYNIGGLYGQKEKAYLRPEWLDTFLKREDDFQFVSYEINELKPFVNWKPAGWWASNKKQPEGKELTFLYKNNLTALKNVLIKVHYAMYDGLPLISKWLTIENTGAASFIINKVKNEILAVVEEESAVVGSPDRMKKQQGIYVETNYAFNNAMRYDISDQTLHWKIDSTYTSQVNYDYNTPCILEIYPDKVSGIILQPGESFTSVRSFELLMDSYDRERRGLAIRKMYTTIAPWTTANPIFMHLVSKNDEEVKRAVDQCAATGYEAVILSFGSHLNMEDSAAKNIQRWTALAEYAHQKGILLGGYSLFSSRRISDPDDGGLPIGHRVVVSSAGAAAFTAPVTPPPARVRSAASQPRLGRRRSPGTPCRLRSAPTRADGRCRW